MATSGDFELAIDKLLGVAVFDARFRDSVLLLSMRVYTRQDLGMVRHQTSGATSTDRYGSTDGHLEMGSSRIV